jgi:hypothetical protein
MIEFTNVMIDPKLAANLSSLSNNEEKEKEEEKQKIIPISSLPSLIGQPLKVLIPDNYITPTGVKEIRNYILRSYCTDRYYLDLIKLPEESTEDFVWVWLDPKHGTLPKRMRRWLKKRIKADPDPAILAEIGNIARRNSESAQEYYFEITDEIEWSSTEFGQASNGSCWWTSGSNGEYSGPSPNSYCRNFLAEGGLAVKFFKSHEDRTNSNGIGRMWIMINPTNAFYGTDANNWAVLFNGYWEGQGATLKLSRILATYLGLGYLKILVEPGQRFYINKDAGYLLGEQSLIQKLHAKIAAVSDEIASINIPRVIPMEFCNICSSSKEKASFQEILDNTRSSIRMCEGCFVDLCVRCTNCADKFDKRSVMLTTVYNVDRLNRASQYCDQCLTRYAAICAGPCGRTIIASNYYNSSIEDRKVCKDCSPKIPRCKSDYCRRRTLQVDAMGDSYCNNCQDEFEREIQLPEIDLLTDNFVVSIVEHNPWNEDNGYRAADPYGGCQCSVCRNDRISKLWG